jgi:hypothetical protein
MLIGVSPDPVTIKLPDPQGAGELPIAMTIPLGSFSPPKFMEPLEPADPKVNEIPQASYTVKTMVAI